MSLSEEMKADALEAQKITRKYFVVGLDFSPQSIDELEGLVEDIEFSLPGGRSDQNLELLVRTWGAYIGEVFRRHGAGEWLEEKAVRVGGEIAQPHGQVRLRLTEGDAHNLSAYAVRFLGCA